MAGKDSKRLSQVARELNVGLSHLAEYLQKKGKDIKARPNVRISADDYQILLQEFSSDKDAKKESEKISTKLSSKQEAEKERLEKEEEKEQEIAAADAKKAEKKSSPEKESEKVFEKDEKETEELAADKPKLKGPQIVDKIDLDAKKEKTAKPEKEESPKDKKEESPVSEKKEKEKKKETPTEEKKTEETKPEKEETPVKAEKKESKTEEPTKEETKSPEKEETPDTEKTETHTEKNKGLNIIDRIDLDSLNQKTRPKKKNKDQLKKEREERKASEEKRKSETQKTSAKEKKEEEKTSEKEAKDSDKDKKDSTEDKDFIATKVDKLSGPTVVGKINLEEEKKKPKKRKKRKRIKKQVVNNTGDRSKNAKSKDGKKDSHRKDIRRSKRPEIKEEDINKKINETLAKLEKKGSKHSTGAKNRKKKREKQQIQRDIQKEQEIENAKTLEVTEFISANELANLMEVNVNEIIKKCFDLGKMVAINQRLDADTISIVVEEFGMEAEFVSIEERQSEEETEEVDESKLLPRSPIVTVMGHVDHGKTSLLDFIRKTNVIAGEAGGIPQHIGAYNVEIDEDRSITFLDTPGHEAFTAMRARGAKVTDLAIIIIAADDDIMPQTDEAISHTRAADVPMIFAINKIDKPGADPQKIKQQLAERNLLVEEWGGKYQSVDISAKEGQNVDQLLEEVLLAAEVLELKANPDKNAEGTVIEAQLDKGRGYVATILIESGTLKQGDIIRSGAFSGRVKAMYNERDMEIDKAGPSEPVMVLGLNGAPIAGDPFKVMENERDARELAQKYGRLKREQSLRTRKHITLDEIGRRIKIGNFKELNVVIKSDVIGSSEALADSFIKQSTEEIQVNVIHKGVGQITEADVNLAAASDAIIIGFQIRPSLGARKLAEQEEIDIRTYSVIYDAISELRAAMEGMLSPEIKEEIRATLEVREVFKISKVGAIAGCYVMDGKINRKDKIRVIRDGLVVYSGEIDTLKRFKDDVKEVPKGYECGLSIENFNDIKKDDIIESFVEIEVAKKLD
jgi:translation initiation factor IF-2